MVRLFIEIEAVMTRAASAICDVSVWGTKTGRTLPKQTNNKIKANHNCVTPINATKPLKFSDFVMVYYSLSKVCSGLPVDYPKLSYIMLSCSTPRLSR